MSNPVKGILGRLAKWLVKKGKEELEKELDKQRSGSPEADRPSAPFDFKRDR